MTSNTHPDMHGSEPDEHNRRCRTNCTFANLRLEDDDECPEGHHSHECNCDSIAEDDAESWAEAQADFLEWLGRPPDEDWSDDD